MTVNWLKAKRTLLYLTKDGATKILQVLDTYFVRVVLNIIEALLYFLIVQFCVRTFLSVFLKKLHRKSHDDIVPFSYLKCDLKVTEWQSYAILSPFQNFQLTEWHSFSWITSAHLFAGKIVTRGIVNVAFT